MKFSVVIPVHNAGEDLEPCLKALSAGKRIADELIVVDDASTDGSIRVAKSYGAKVVSLAGKPHGPAFARNRGAEIAEGNILLFLDADVEVHADTIERIEQIFQTETEISALFGSYDDSPKAKGVISNYCNLRHHWTHQHSAREAWTFWSGCGAIQREDFLEVGGFDESYVQPSVEDIALGRELVRTGHRILLCPEVQVKHLKCWTLKSWLQTDIFKRAIPWTKMLLSENKGLPADLNLDWKSRVSAIGAWLLVLLIMAGAWNSILWWGVPIAFASVAICNWPLFQFFLKRGKGLALGAIFCHCLYFLYSSAIVVLLTLESKTHLPPAHLKRSALSGLLLAAFLKGLLWSLIIPPFQTPDEPQHFLYGYEIARQNTFSILPDRTVPFDAWLLGDLVTIACADKKEPLNFSDQATLRKQLLAIDTPTEKRVIDRRQLITVPNFVMYHPAGYYTLLSLTQKPLLTQSIRWRLLAGRWLSVFLGVLTVGLSYAIGREIWPNHHSYALLLGTLVAFQPMSAFTLASVTNDAALFTIFTLALWQGLFIIRKGMNLSRGIAVGTTLICGLLTKMSFAVMVPLMLLLLLWRCYRELKVRRKQKFNRTSVTNPLVGWGLILILPVLFSGSWYANRLGMGSSHLIQATLTQKPIIDLPHGRIQQAFSPPASDWESQLRRQFTDASLTSLAVKYVRVITSYWGNFGWVNIRIPSVLWILLLFVTVYVVIAGTSHLLASNRQKSTNELIITRWQRRSLWWLASASASIIVFYAFVDWRTLTTAGGQFGLRGGYYLPAIAGQMSWLMLCGGRWSNKSGVWATTLGTMMVVFNFYCLFAVVGQRYYATNSPFVQTHLSANLQPLSLFGINLICVGTLVSAGCLLLILRGLVQNEHNGIAPQSRPFANRAS